MMNLKSLVSGIAAAALVSSIGLAYAQNNQQSGTSPTPQQTVQGAPGSTPSTDMNNPNMSPGMSSDPSATTDMGRDARTDRN